MQMLLFLSKCNTLYNLRPPMLWMYPEVCIRNNIHFDITECTTFINQILPVFLLPWTILLETAHGFIGIDGKKYTWTHKYETKVKETQSESNLKNEWKKKTQIHTQSRYRRHGRVFANTLKSNNNKFGEKNSVNFSEYFFVCTGAIQTSPVA